MGEGHPQGHHEEEEGEGEEELVSQEGEGEGEEELVSQEGEEELVPQEVGAMEGGLEIQGGGEGEVVEVVLPGHLRAEEVEEEGGWSRCQVGVGEGEGEEVEQVQLQERVAEPFPKLQPLTSAAPLGGGREHYKEM